MLTHEIVDTLLAPIADASSPCGEDLEYDPAFTALEAASQGKPEQQFGDTVIPAVEPEWSAVAVQAQALLQRAKDVRPGVLLLRAATRTQGLGGFHQGLVLLNGLLERYWDHIHPQLDADDGNDPTMRLNALAPLGDESMVLRDLHEAVVGTARGMGPLKVRDIALSRGLITGSEGGPSSAQVQGALEEILAEHPPTAELMRDLPAQLARLQQLLSERSGRAEAVDLARLRGLSQALRQACDSAAGTPADDAAPDDATTAAGDAPGAAARTAPRGEIQSRQDVLQTLDRCIRYLEQSEPGNPAPLLLERAKKLIGVSFLEIMANLAPNALDTIETVTGKRPADE